MKMALEGCLFFSTLLLIGCILADEDAGTDWYCQCIPSAVQGLNQTGASAATSSTTVTDWKCWCIPATGLEQTGAAAATSTAGTIWDCQCITLDGQGLNQTGESAATSSATVVDRECWCTLSPETGAAAATSSTAKTNAMWLMDLGLFKEIEAYNRIRKQQLAAVAVNGDSEENDGEREEKAKPLSQAEIDELNHEKVANFFMAICGGLFLVNVIVPFGAYIFYRCKKPKQKEEVVV